MKTGFTKTYILGLIGDMRVQLDPRLSQFDRIGSASQSASSWNQAAPHRGKAGKGSRALSVVATGALYPSESICCSGRRPQILLFGRARLRVSDRMQRLGRTPRLSRFLVGAEAEIDDLLVRRALRYAFALAKEEARPALSFWRVFSFAERTRTRFIQQEIAATYGGLPNGASRPDVEHLFEWRRSWNEAELRLLEYESRPTADGELLEEMQKRRTTAEARYRRELRQIQQAFDDPEFDPDRPVLPLNFMQWRPAVKKYLKKRKAALVEYHMTSEELVIFTVLPSATQCRPVRYRCTSWTPFGSDGQRSDVLQSTGSVLQ